MSSVVLMSLSQLGLSWIGDQAGRTFVYRLLLVHKDVNRSVRVREPKV